MIELACPRCGTRLSFAPEQAGASGPCYACGASIVVPRPMAPAMPSTPPPRAPMPLVAPTDYQQRTLATVAAEAAKHGIQTLGTKVVALGDEVSAQDNMSAALRASFGFGGRFRVDRAQSIALRPQNGDLVLLVIPWSRAVRLAHEYASILPGTMPSCLKLGRGLMGSWSTGRFMGTRGGESDPIAQAAERDASINDGIEWNWESGRLKIELSWGLQAVPFDASRTLHVMHTADRGIVFRDFGVRWYFDRRVAFTKFIQANAGPAAVPAFDPPPLATLFTDDLRG